MEEIGLTKRDEVVAFWITWVDGPVEVYLMLSDETLLDVYTCTSTSDAVAWCLNWAEQRRMIATAPPSYIDRVQGRGAKDVTLNLYGPYKED